MEVCDVWRYVWRCVMCGGMMCGGVSCDVWRMVWRGDN